MVLRVVEGRESAAAVQETMVRWRLVGRRLKISDHLTRVVYALGLGEDRSGNIQRGKRASVVDESI